MNPTLTALIVFACLIAAVLLGRTLRGLLPEGHLSTESKDAVKLAMGLVATMSALVLGLLVSSAKGAYDTERSEVIQMASKVAFLDRVLAAYGPEAAGVRAQFRDNVGEGIRQIWPGEIRRPANLLPIRKQGNVVYRAIQRSFAAQRHAGGSQVTGSDAGCRRCSDSVTARGTVGSLDIEADVDHTCLMARHHFPWLQRARAAQCHYPPRFDGLGACRLRRYFPDPRVG